MLYVCTYRYSGNDSHLTQHHHLLSFTSTLMYELQTVVQCVVNCEAKTTLLTK